jgi:TetR/AcrR family transcriptional regulator, transcriptional repressor for nem operon
MSDTRTKILDVAEKLTQTNGFNGFSYIDLANEIGIKTSSIHYHFKRKDDLAAALVERVHEQHAEGFRAMEVSNESIDARLRAVIAYFQDYIANQRYCLCGMIAVELQSVSTRVAKLVQAYFRDFQAWLKRQFELAGKEDSERLAIGFLSALEGSLLLGRLNGDPGIISNALAGYVST